MSKLGPTAIDFMKGLLQLDPKKRLNSDTVFKHKYFSCFINDEKNEKEKEKKKISIISNKRLLFRPSKKQKNVKILESREKLREYEKTEQEKNDEEDINSNLKIIMRQKI